jgi:hypothetical protein
LRSHLDSINSGTSYHTYYQHALKSKQNRDDSTKRGGRYHVAEADGQRRDRAKVKSLT